MDLESATVDEITETAAKFKIHPLAVQAILEGEERPRIQDFESHTFIVLQPLKHMDGDLEFCEMQVVLSKEWILTFHKEPGKSD